MRESAGRLDRSLSVMAVPCLIVAESGLGGEVICVDRERLDAGLRGC